MTLLLIPITKGVALPYIDVSVPITHEYLKRIKNKLKPGTKCAIVYANSVEPFLDLDAFEKIDKPAIVSVGCCCEVREDRKMFNNENIDATEVVFTGLYPVVINEVYVSKERDCILVECEERKDFDSSTTDLAHFESRIIDIYSTIRNFYPGLKPIEIPSHLGYDIRPYYYAHEFGLSDNTQLRLLRENNATMRYSIVIDALNMANLTPQIRSEVDMKTNSAIQRGQREYVLREQAKQLRELLKEFDGDDSDAKYTKALKEGTKVYPQYVLDRIRTETNRLKLLGYANQEAAICRNYLDLIIKLPWKKSTVDNEDLDVVKKVLDDDHYGLEKQKERILEYLAVKNLTKSLKAPILCLYGPPGTGKTSLAISVAKALNRKFVKFALGGVYDESEIRGHRRTYVGALPGRIISGIANCGTNNPVFLLDEIDKMEGGGYHGDPAAACLEILDPEQNIYFEDHYLDMPFDLSNVLFICTANDLSEVPPPLRDRLELIELNTYTLYEKMHIAKNHLIKQELKANGLTEDMIHFTDESLEYIIDSYTREAGVRELRRKIGTIMRKFSVEYLANKVKTPFEVTIEVVEKYLNKPIFFHTQVVKDQVGIVNGLAYTSYGGEIQPIECNVTDGNGSLVRTGNLGDVMRESITIAFSYVKVLAKKYGYDQKYFSTHDFHIHCPEGAVPKDGPSAGCAITIALLSAITDTPVNNLVAMTGEVDLRGNSMQIGGLREKTLAAVREHMKTVLIPKDNHNDTLELPSEVKDNLKIIECKTVEDIIPHIFLKKIKKYVPPKKSTKEKESKKKVDD